MLGLSLRQVVVTLAAVGALGSSASSQEPTKRVRPEVVIPFKKEVTEVPPPAPPMVMVPGTKTEVVLPPQVTRIVLTEAGPGTVLVERAPAIGGRGLPWFPLLGLLGGAVLLGSLDNNNESDTTTAVVPTVPEVPVTPPVTPPITPIPEPMSLVLFATGLAGIALARRHVRKS